MFPELTGFWKHVPESGQLCREPLHCDPRRPLLWRPGRPRQHAFHTLKMVRTQTWEQVCVSELGEVSEPHHSET